MQGRIEAVLGIGDAPSPPQGAAVGAAVPRAARVVDACHGEAPGGEELQGEVEPGLARRRRAPVAPGHERWRDVGPASALRRRRRRHRPVERPVHWPARPSGQRERFGVRDIAAHEHSPRRRAQRSCRLRPGCPHPHVRRRVGRAPDHRQTVAVRAQRGDRHAGLVQRDGVGRRGAGAGAGGRRQAHHGIAAGRSHPGRDGAVGELGDGRLAEHPVRSVELGRRVGQGVHLALRAGQAWVDVGLPPSSAVGDKAQRAVALPRRLPDRLGRPARDPPGGPGRPQGCGAGEERHHDEDRGIPRHVGVLPDHDGQALRRRVDPGRAEEVVPLEQGALAQRLFAGVDSATTLRTGRDAPSRWTSRTARTQAPSGVALSPPWL